MADEFDFENVKLGLLPQLVADPRDLKLAKYMAAAPLLPPTPPALNWAPAGLNWGAKANNSLGDCVPAAAVHMIQSWSANVGEFANPTDDQTIDAYCRACRYDRSNPNTDAGCFLTTVLQYWRETGIASGVDPIVYQGVVLSGTFQFHENVTSQTNRVMRAKVIGRDRQGRIVPVNPTFGFTDIWGHVPIAGLTNDVQGDHVDITPAGPAMAQEIITVNVPGAPVLSQTVQLKPFTACIAALNPGALTVVNCIKPFAVGDIIVGDKSGARFRVDSVGPMPTFHKILAYVSLALGWDASDLVKAQAQQELKYAVQIFGGAFIAVALPLSVKGQTTWTVTGDPTVTGPALRWSWGGHCVFVAGYDADYVYFVSWGSAGFKMTWDFYFKYVNQSFGLVAMDWISKASLLSASGFDLGTMLDDLAIVTA